MLYTDFLKATAERYSSFVCLGLDPVIDEIPIQVGSPITRIVIFYESILEEIVRSRIYPAAVKPNYAFYAQYGLEGIEALVTVIKMYKAAGFPVILDVKRGDIGTTAEAYSRESFIFFNADAVTVSPFLGVDSITPFVTDYPDRGVYILNKTSNKSSSDLQDLLIDGHPLYLYLSNKIVQWNSGTLGAVVGATYPDQLSSISELFIKSGQEIPLLIPGIGSQGGSVEEVCTILRRFPDPRIHRINSSSAINYAYKKHPGISYSSAAVKELDKLNRSINSIIFS
jgi:orotidine-5'-phosphate decarboxylase